MSERDTDLEAAFEAGLIETVRREAMAVFGANQTYPCHDVMAMKTEIDRLRSEIDRQNNRYVDMSAEADRLSKMVTAFRNQDDAIRAEFGGKRDGRPTIECVRDAFAAKWSAEDALFQTTLNEKTEDLRDEVARLSAENERLRAALLDIDNACKNPGSWSEIVMERIIERVEEIARTALQDKSDE